MTDALTVPHAVAAVVLLLAGAGKLRAPAPAARAVGLAPVLIRAFAAFELSLGAVALLTASDVSSALMAATYVGFAGLTLVLQRRATPCGCFGQEAAPASAAQSLLSGALALVCAGCAIAGPPALGWILARPAGFAAVLVLGTAGAAYGTVLAYSELPLAWRSWRPEAGRLMRPPAVASPDGERRPAAGRLMRPPAVASPDGERRPA